MFSMAGQNAEKSHYNYPEIARNAGFKFLRSDTQNNLIDWRFIGNIDIDEIIINNDFERIGSAISHICDAPLGQILKTSILDSSVSKYFLVAQLTIQYLLFCTQFLERSVTDIKGLLRDSEKQVNKLTKCVRKKDAKLLNLLKRTHENRNPIFSCTKCTKNFNSLETLNTHMTRKHSLEKSQPVSDTNLINAIKFELEIKQLKERIQTTEKEVSTYKKIEKSVECSVCENRSSICYSDKCTETDPNRDLEQKDLNASNNQGLANLETAMDEIRKQLTTTLLALSNEFKGINTDKSIAGKNSLTNNISDNVIVSLEKQFSAFEQLLNDNREKLKQNIEDFDNKFSQNLNTLENSLKLSNLPPVPQPRTIFTNSPKEQTITNPQPARTVEIIHVSTDTSSEDDIPLATRYDRNHVVNHLLSKTISKPRDQPILVVPSSLKRNTSIPKIYHKVNASRLLESRMSDIGLDPHETALSMKSYRSILAKLNKERKDGVGSYNEILHGLKVKLDDIVNKQPSNDQHNDDVKGLEADRIANENYLNKPGTHIDVISKVTAKKKRVLFELNDRFGRSNGLPSDSNSEDC